MNYTEQDLITFAASVNRILLAKALGQHLAYEGERDYYEVFGYNPSPTIDDYADRYRREDIAARIINLPANDTWKKPPVISEDDNAETPFVKEWEALARRLRIWSMLSRVDKLSGVGHFGALLVGVRDGEDLGEAIDQGSLKGEKGILYLRPFSEEKVTIKTWEEDTGNVRYGLPELYTVKLRDDKKPVDVHWTRILHVAEGKTDTEIYGTPRLMNVYNRLDDLMKIVGGSAEATWLNMRPGTLLTNQPDYSIPQDADAKEARLEEIRRYAHDPLRFLMLEGMDASQVGASEVVDPTGPFNVQISLIAAATEIPQRVLLGSAAGELAAASEDMKQWAGTIASRQTNYAEPEILRPFIDRLIWYGVLPMPASGYDIGMLDDSGVRRWPPLLEMSELEQAEIMQKKALANRALVNPLTGESPSSESEQRELLGLPAEREESLIDEEPVVQMLVAAAKNYRDGAVGREALARYAFAVGMEAIGEQ
jgi:hypothetical protein